MTWEGLSPPYRTIVADPPWRVNHINGWGNTGTRSAPDNLPYSTMTVDEIRLLRVAEIAADVAHLYLWTVNRHLLDAYQVVDDWGFRPVSLLTWIKPTHGLGTGGHFVSTTEFILFGRRGVEGKRGIKKARRHDSSWFAADRGRHSVKPAAFFDIVERVSPGPYVELFARQPRLGWDSWGWGYETMRAGVARDD